MSQFNRLPGEFCVVFKHFQDLKNLMLSILREKLTLALWDLFYSKPYKALRVAQCKQPWLNFDLNVLLHSFTRDHSLILPPRYPQVNHSPPPEQLLKLYPSASLDKGASIPHFQITAFFFCCPLFFEYLNPRVRINEMLREHPVLVL